MKCGRNWLKVVGNRLNKNHIEKDDNLWAHAGRVRPFFYRPGDLHSLGNRVIIESFREVE
jgi:hypothetical protein